MITDGFKEVQRIAKVRKESLTMADAEYLHQLLRDGVLRHVDDEAFRAECAEAHMACNWRHAAE